MLNYDLLADIQPEGGWFAIVGIGQGYTKQTLVETREEFDALVASYVEEGRDVFFGIAKYKTDENRTKDNIYALKCLWLDLDCGENKPYAGQTEALDALIEFCKKLALPRPTVVDSGRGLHVYWPFDEELPREEWEALSGKLRRACEKEKLYADTACFDAARILRVPGTFNFKYGIENPLEVGVLLRAEPGSLERINKALHPYQSLVDILGKPKFPVNSEMRRLWSNCESNFAKILDRSLKGEGCNQIRSAYAQRDSLSYQRWFDVLSIAKFCEDADTAIHTVSEGHPTYSPEATERQARSIKGPHRCETFEINNPEGCNKCPFREKVSSPIALGRVVVPAEGGGTAVEEDGFGEERIVSLPECPWPYFRGRNGGIYKKRAKQDIEDAEDDVTDELGDDEDVLVYKHDLHVMKRMINDEGKEVLLLRLALPKDKVKELQMPSGITAAQVKIKEFLAEQGVYTNTKRHNMIANYIQLAAAGLQEREEAQLMRNQFGWADNHRAFIIGNSEIRPDGAHYTPMANKTLQRYADMLQPVGTFEKWKEVADLYGQPGFEPHAFAMATAFGAPLLHMLGQSGAVINLVHTSSGTGKTTVLRMANSVSGCPKDLLGQKEDTYNAKIMRAGMLNNIVVPFDEMTKTKGEDLGNFLYMAPQGKGKERMMGASNELRVNNTTWSTFFLCSSNKSFYQVLAENNIKPEGESMRLIEYTVNENGVLEPLYAKRMFDTQLEENYGHAMPRYIKFIINNWDEIKQYVLNTQATIDGIMRYTQKERFWSVIHACNAAGMNIASDLDLIGWDTTRIFNWSKPMMRNLRNELVPPSDPGIALFNSYMRENISNILVIDEDGQVAAEPKIRLAARIEKKNGQLFIPVPAFKKHCYQMQGDYNEAVKELRKAGIVTGSVSKRIASGYTGEESVVDCCLVIDMNHSDCAVINIEEGEGVEV